MARPRAGTTRSTSSSASRSERGARAFSEQLLAELQVLGGASIERQFPVRTRFCGSAEPGGELRLREQTLELRGEVFDVAAPEHERLESVARNLVAPAARGDHARLAELHRFHERERERLFDRGNHADVHVAQELRTGLLLAEDVDACCMRRFVAQAL